MDCIAIRSLRGDFKNIDVSEGESTLSLMYKIQWVTGIAMSCMVVRRVDGSNPIVYDASTLRNHFVWPGFKIYSWIVRCSSQRFQFVSEDVTPLNFDDEKLKVIGDTAFGEKELEPFQLFEREVLAYPFATNDVFDEMPKIEHELKLRCLVEAAKTCNIGAIVELIQGSPFFRDDSPMETNLVDPRHDVDFQIFCSSAKTPFIFPALTGTSDMGWSFFGSCEFNEAMKPVMCDYYRKYFGLEELTEDDIYTAIDGPHHQTISFILSNFHFGDRLNETVSGTSAFNLALNFGCTAAASLIALSNEK